MNIKVYIDKDRKNEELELEDNSPVKEMLKKLNINPVTVIVSRNNTLILEDEKLNDKDELKVLSVISGG